VLYVGGVAYDSTLLQLFLPHHPSWKIGGTDASSEPEKFIIFELENASSLVDFRRLESATLQISKQWQLSSLLVGIFNVKNATIYELHLQNHLARCQK
jgi:hypothetical protein